MKPHVAQQDAIADENERWCILLLKAYVAQKSGLTAQTYQQPFLGVQNG